VEYVLQTKHTVYRVICISNWQTVKNREECDSVLVYLILENRSQFDY